MIKNALSNSSSRDERIVAQYMMLYIYKILRLNIIAIFITYLIGCLWYFICFLIDQEINGHRYDLIQVQKKFQKDFNFN